MPFCDLEQETAISIPTTTTAAVDDAPMALPTLNYFSTTNDYPVTIGGWIYMILIMFLRLVLLFVL